MQRVSSCSSAQIARPCCINTCPSLAQHAHTPCLRGLIAEHLAPTTQICASMSFDPFVLLLFLAVRWPCLTVAI